MKKSIVYLLSSSILLFSSRVIHAQPPVNDECVGAIAVNTTLFGNICSSSISTSTLTATASVSLPTCGGSSADDDIWYRFNANSSSVVIRVENALNTTTGFANIAMEVYSGTCTGLSSIFCINGFAFANGYRLIDGLSAGSIYYIRFWTVNSNNRATFDFCVQDVPAAPANDDCSGAIAITTQPFGSNCSNSVTINTTGATHSSPDPSCGVIDSNDDLWYSFIANSSSIILRYSNAVLTTSGNNGTIGYALYNGACPSTTSTLSCSSGFGFSDGFQIINSLNIGSTYYLRLFSQGTNNYIRFDFCIQDVPAPPANDECINSFPITTQPFGTICNNSVSANTTGSTHSSPDPSCGTNDSNDDLWYSFTANSSSIVLRYTNAILTTSGNNGTVGYALYSGACPSTTTTISCSAGFGFNDGLQIINGLNIGATYYLRLFSQGFNNYIRFDFCIQDVPAPPANDDCVNAIPVPVQPFGSSCSTSVAANTTGSTHSSPDPSCGINDSNDDLWYSFTANSASVILRFTNGIITTNSNSGSLGYVVYDGSCPSNTSSMVCVNSFGFNNGYQIINGLTIGNNYLLRLFSQGTNNYMSFDFCLQTVPAPPVNDECTGAISILLGAPGTNCLASVNATTNGATASANAPSCALSNSNNDDIWYTFIANASTSILRYSNCIESTTGDFASLGYALYTNCPTSSSSISCSNSFGFRSGAATLSGLTPGNTYYLRLFASNINNYASFNFCIQTPLQNDECLNAINIPVTNGFCSNPVIASLNGATTSSGFSFPSCSFGSGSKDVWFTVTVPATGNLIIQTSAVKSSARDLVMTAYSGTCGSFTEIVCDDNGNPETPPSENHSRITLTSRTAGEIIYLRVTPVTSASEEQFAICAWDETISVLPLIGTAGNCTDGIAGVIDSTRGNLYMWVPLFDNSGNIIAEIYSDGNELGSVTTSYYVHSGPPRQVGSRYYLDRNINIQTSIAPTTPVKVRIYFKQSELSALQNVDPAVNGPNDLKITKTSTICQPAYSGTPTVISQQVNSGYGPDHYLQFLSPAFSSFYIDALNGVLPLKFLSFIAKQNQSHLLLDWEVAKDSSILHFEIQKSDNGIDFKTIATKSKVDIFKDNINSWNYSYTWVNNSSGFSYYRIKMISVTGQTLYSSIEFVKPDLDKNKLLLIYPNPASDQIMIEIPGNRNEKLLVSILNIAGKNIQTIQKNFSNGKASLNISYLQNGIYLVRVESAGQLLIGKIVKQ